MKEILRKSLAVTILLVCQWANAGSEATPATPFGVEMGLADACTALPKELRKIDPRIVSSSPGLNGVELPGTYRYAPVDKVFPGARHSIFVSCIEGRIQALGLTVDKGVGNSILIEVNNDLEAKYKRFDSLESVGLIFNQGGRILYGAKDASVVVNIDKNREYFSILYQYHGAMTADAANHENKLPRNTANTSAEVLGPKINESSPLRLLCSLEWTQMIGNSGASSQKWHDKQEIQVLSRADGTLVFKGVNGRRQIDFDTRKGRDTTRLIDSSAPSYWKFEKIRDTSIGASPPIPGPIWEQRLYLDRSTGQFRFSTEISFPGSDLENNKRIEGFCEKINEEKLKF